MAYAYVTNNGAGSVSKIDISTFTTVGTALASRAMARRRITRISSLRHDP